MKTHEELRDERDFLLRSLDDLEAERADGNIDDDTYKLLHDDYTARAAAVIRTLDDDREQTNGDGGTPARSAMRVATIAGVVVFVVLVAVGLAHEIGQRPPGGTGSGKQFSAAASSDPCAAPKAAAAATPKSYNARVDYAQCLIQQQDLSDASEQFFAAAQIDPKQPEPLAYIGWLSAVQSSQATNATLHNSLLSLAHSSLARAIQVDPTYPDSYVFEGLLLDRYDNKPAAAVPYLRKFLALAPKDHPMRPQVQQLLSQALAARKP
jgi:cytochrome c-type biogenesis protein CcmH/NrfG